MKSWVIKNAINPPLKITKVLFSHCLKEYVISKKKQSIKRKRITLSCFKSRPLRNGFVFSRSTLFQTNENCIKVFFLWRLLKLIHFFTFFLTKGVEISEYLTTRSSNARGKKQMLPCVFQWYINIYFKSWFDIVSLVI